MPKLTPVLDKETIAHKVDSIAKQISADYHNRDVVLVCVHKGAFIFMADFVRLSSYGNDKNERRPIDFQPDDACYSTEEGFLVGYGHDCAEAYRN